MNDDTTQPNTPDTPGTAPTITGALASWLASVQASRSPRTYQTYSYAAKKFVAHLTSNPTTITSISDLTSDHYASFIASLRPYSAATERLYLIAIAGFYEHAAAEGWIDINPAVLKRLRARRGRKNPVRLPPFPKDEIETILTTASADPSKKNTRLNRLRHLRDRAILFTLADTGLRLSELIQLQVDDVDWEDARTTVIGKGDRQATIRISDRAMGYLTAYLKARSYPYGPLFAAHGERACGYPRALSARGVQWVVQQWAERVDAQGVTPHTFRHYFVTVVLRRTGSIRLAQELARHRSIVTTQRYVHLADRELDEGYEKAFNGG